MVQLNALKAFYEISGHQIDIIQERVIKQYTRNKKSVGQPTAIIIGGQPGSGKSELIIKALDMLNDNAVVCNADDYRDFHPKTNDIKRNHEKYYPEITVSYAQKWNNGLRAYCENNSLNYILETTFSSGERMNDTIRQIKLKGYRVVIMILAVPAALSILGTHIRFEEMKRIEGFGRLVERKVHLEKYLAVPGTIKKVEEAKLYDGLYIYGRQSTQGKSSPKSGVKLIDANPSYPLNVYLKERDKKWSAGTISYFNSACLSVIGMMAKRDASTNEMKAFLKGLIFK